MKGKSDKSDNLSGVLSDFEKSCLDTHNHYRAIHKAPALVYNKTLAAYARDYVDKQTCIWPLTPSDGPYGENLSKGNATAYDSITTWYNEEKLYNYDSPGYFKQTKHFSQMIWKAAGQLGCAEKSCIPGSEARGIFLMCTYDVAYNLTGFPENVLPPAK